VNTGACDPVSEICDFARKTGAWVYVDRAFGLWAAAAPERKHLVEGASNADSWAVDAHKMLNVSHDSGLAIVRSGKHLRAAMAINADYLNLDSKRHGMQFVPES